MHALADVQRDNLMHVVQHEALDDRLLVADEDLLRLGAERVPQVYQLILAAADELLVPSRPAHRVDRLAVVPVVPPRGIRQGVPLAFEVGDARQPVAAPRSHGVELTEVAHRVDPTVVYLHPPHRLVPHAVATPRRGSFPVGHVDHPPDGHRALIVPHGEVIAVLIVDDPHAALPRRGAQGRVGQAAVRAHADPSLGVVDLDLAIGARDEHALRRGELGGVHDVGPAGLGCLAMGHDSTLGVVVRPDANGAVSRRGGVGIALLEAHDGRAHVLVLVHGGADDAFGAVFAQDVLGSVHGFARLLLRDSLQQDEGRELVPVDGVVRVGVDAREEVPEPRLIDLRDHHLKGLDELVDAEVAASVGVCLVECRLELLKRLEVDHGVVATEGLRDIDAGADCLDALADRLGGGRGGPVRAFDLVGTHNSSPSDEIVQNLLLAFRGKWCRRKTEISTCCSEIGLFRPNVSLQSYCDATSTP